MWGGLYNPMGSYAFPTHYGDGTPVYSTDFSATKYPDADFAYSRQWIYGELDYHKMAAPATSCTTFRMTNNNVVRAVTTKHFNKDVIRPVVCEGKI